MTGFWYLYGFVSLALAVYFLFTFGPRFPADWHFYGWKKALSMTCLVLGFSWLFPPIVVLTVLYLGGFWLFQNYKVWRK